MTCQYLTAVLLLLCTTPCINGSSINSAQYIARPANAVDRERFTKLVQYDYEICPEVPSLHCRNGSTCTPGIASFAKKHDHLDLQTHESGYYCKCLPGFIGHECGLEVDDCGSSTQPGVLRSCYHGASCKSNNSGSYCDCIELNDNSDPTDTKFEGEMCQHESTSLCAVSLVGEQAPNHQFCTNHGKCVKMVTGGEPHPGCICKDGWMGDHCEISQDPFATLPQMQSAGGGTSGKVLVSVLVVAIVAAVATIGVIMMKARRKRNAADGPSPVVFQGQTKTKTVVGEGDLEPDGSGTLGSPTKDREGATEDGDDGDMELSANPGYVPETEVV